MGDRRCLYDGAAEPAWCLILCLCFFLCDVVWLKLRCRGLEYKIAAQHQHRRLQGQNQTLVIHLNLHSIFFSIQPLLDITIFYSLIPSSNDMRKLWPLLAQYSSASGGAKGYIRLSSRTWTHHPSAPCASHHRNAVRTRHKRFSREPA